MIGRIWRKICTCVYALVHPNFRKAVMYAVPRVYFSNKLKLGTRVHINDSVFINAVGGVEIGDYSILSHGVSIISTKNDTIKWVKRNLDADVHINQPISIGSNVWLCANVTVCSGVKIANNSVVAAGAVVVNDLLEPNSLYAGMPAKFVKHLEE